MHESAADGLFAAIKTGDYDRVKAMVSADPSLVDARGKGGESAVLAAVYNRHKTIANLLVARGAALTLPDASAAGEVEHVERLLAADPSAIGQYSHDGWTALHLAAHFGHGKVIELLLDRGADPGAVSRNALANTPLHAALAGNHALAAGLLIGRGADVNAADAALWRPLHHAAHINNLDAMKALIAQGADVTAVNRDGLTPAAMAAARNHKEAAALLDRFSR